MCVCNELEFNIATAFGTNKNHADQSGFLGSFAQNSAFIANVSKQVEHVHE